MATFLTCVLLFMFVETIYSVNEPGYLITTPNRFIPERPETVCIHLYNVPAGVTTRVKLTVTPEWSYRSSQYLHQLSSGKEQIVEQQSVVISPAESSKCVALTVPPFSKKRMPKKLKIEAVGMALNGNSTVVSFHDSALVDIYREYSNRYLSFVQTDKSVYAPGDLVRIRILTLDSLLRPSLDMIDSVTIQTPSRIRVEHWANLTLTKGLLQLEFELNEEPEMGNYRITMNRQSYTVREEFEVKEYVLPKYEVTLTTPSQYITFQTERITAKICARYTYGQPVRGTLESSVCLKKSRQYYYYYPRNINDGKPEGGNETCILVENQLEDGCYMVNVSGSDVGYTRYTDFRYGLSVEISGRVKEKGTGVYTDASKKTLSFQRRNIQLNLEGADKFKLGIPYYAKVTAKTLDGTPVPSYRHIGKTLTTDVNGEASFSVRPPEDNQGSSYFRIQASASTRSTRRSSFDGYISSASLSPNQRYSPTGSFIQIAPRKGKATCGAQATFDIHYVSNISLDTSLYYQVIGLTDIVDSGSIPVSLEPNYGTNQVVDDGWSCYYRCLVSNLEEIGGSETGNSSTVLGNSTTTEGPATTTGMLPVAPLQQILRLNMTITSEMSDKPKLVVYYIRPDGEVIADEMEIDVEPCTSNQAEMTFSKSKARPGEPIGIQFKASPESLCSYGIVDKSVFLEGGNNQLSLSSALKRIRNIGLNRWTGSPISSTGEYYCGLTPTNDTHYFNWEVEGADDSVMEFINAGLVPMSNLRVKTRPCKLYANIRYCGGTPTRYSSHSRKCEPSLAGTPGRTGPPGAPGRGRNNGERGQAGAPGQQGAAGAPGFDAQDADVASRKSASFSAGAPGQRGDQAVDINTLRTYFPETWLWDLVDTESSGHVTVPSTVPDTITEWVGNAVCMNDIDGIGVSKPASLIAFQPFFVSMNLPYSVIRAEKVPVAVTVSNYLSKCMAVSISLNPSTEYDIEGKSSGVSCVCGQDTATRKFTITMKEIGDVNVSITAEVINHPSVCSGAEMSTRVGMSDTVIRPLIVEPEGTPREYTVSDFVCMTRPDTVTGEYNSTYIENYTLPMPGGADLVVGSERAFVKVVGDVLGPALSNIGSLLRMPYGCAEQIMVSFAPNIFILQYLEARNKDSPELRAKAIRYLKSGYQRELTHAHRDQSYSSFGPLERNKPGSMWLTAFVVKCFGLAQPYIYIDKSIMSKSISFFINNQDRDGCFPQIGAVHNKYMQGGFGQSRNNTNKAALTAFVVISMIESGVEPTEASITNAFRCIDSQTYTDAYTTSIVAYAYSLYDPSSVGAVNVYDKLMSMAKVNGPLTMWRANENEPIPPVIHWWYYRPRSADIETTAYALLATLNMVRNLDDKVGKGLPIVRWLSTQRNSWGGFGSTQDTVIGLQALARYATLIYSDGLQASIVVSESSSRTQVATFELNNVNSFVEYTEKIPRVTDLSLTATGKGCFLMQANVRYNINKPDSERQSFHTSATVFGKERSTNICKEHRLRICTKYTGEGGVSNMAIVEVKMVSGWAVDQSILKSLMKDRDIALRRFEVEKTGTVQLYFDSLGPAQKCFNLEVSQHTDVKDAKPAVVTTYDYYKTELRQELEYIIPECYLPTTTPQNATTTATPTPSQQVTSAADQNVTTTGHLNTTVG